MKNIFKLGSVFMALALLVSTLLFTGVFAAAEPDWQLVWSGTIDVDLVQASDRTIESVGTASFGVASLDEAVAAELANYDATKFKVESNAEYTPDGDSYACWCFFKPIADGPQLWAAVVNEAPSTEITSSDDVAIADLDETWKFGIVGEGGSGHFSAPEFALYAYREAATEETTATEAEVTETETQAEPTETQAEPTETGAEPTETGAEPTETGAEPTETGAEPTETQAEPTETQAEPTETQVEPTETQVEPTETQVEPTETQAEPVTLVETVLVENNVGGEKALKAGKTDAWFLVVNEIKADVAKNGPIDPAKGEYYELTVTASVSSGEADFHLGEGLDWAEYWGESGCVTTEPSTVTAQIPVAIPAEGIGDVYLADSGEEAHILTWTYAKVSVFRVGTPTEPTEPSENPTEVEPTAMDVQLGDANNDGDINMKDVLTLRKYIAGIEVEINEAAADANADGDINMKDVLLLRKFIAGLIDAI